MTKEKFTSISLQEEMQRSYLEYAMSVIIGRALPDARDGLKPVQRRILFAMHELGLTPDRPFRKCARVVGDVLGKYHPHGDQAVYEALVRLVQDFSTKYPTLDGHGNFGSVDNDPPAAMRYTETRLAPIAHECFLQEIGSETVSYSNNFDGSQQEPDILPAQLPFLLLNGSSGIAVGMATNIPPHNLGEIVDGLIALIKNKDILIIESELKLADESAEHEKALIKTESGGNTVDARSSDYGDDLNVDERKTYLAERVVNTKDFSGDRQLMLNELLKRNKSCQDKDDLYRLAVESIQLTPDDKAAWHALVKVAATDNDLSFLMLSIVIGKNAKWYADKYDYDDLIEVERNFSFWIKKDRKATFKLLRFNSDMTLAT